MTAVNFENTLLAEVSRTYPQAEAALMELLAIPSVESAPQEDAPFGRPVAQALCFLQNLAEQLGLSAAMDPDGYYLTVDLGYAAARPGEAVGILSHADVVPFGEGWHYAPTGQLLQDRIYGRGALDDKGPTIATLFAMAALARLGAPLARPVRLIIGGNEESGCRCIKKYVEDHPIPPALGFSPDANFPVIFAEKGIAMFRLTMPLTTPAAAPHIREIHAGTVVNAVPGQAEATICNLTLAAAQELLGCRDRVTLRQNADNSLLLTVLGKAAHGSQPEKGLNAAARLLALLLLLPLDPCQLTVIEELHRLFGQDYLGKAVGLATDDSVSGPLTLNLGTLHLQDGLLTLQLDMRYPVTADFAPLYERLQQVAHQAGLKLKVSEHKPPLYVPRDRPLVRELLSLYQEYEPTAQPLAVGGGTYCRAFANFVAFGPLRADMADTMHQADEFICRTDLQFLQKIYAQAIWRLAAK